MKWAVVLGFVVVLMIGCAAQPIEQPVRESSSFERSMNSILQAYIADRQRHQEEVRRLSEELELFGADVRILLQKISALKSHPGWPDMERLIQSGPGLIFVEGASTAALKMSGAFETWETKWKVPRKLVLDPYMALGHESREIMQWGADLRQRFVQSVKDYEPETIPVINKFFGSFRRDASGLLFDASLHDQQGYRR